MPRYDVFMPEPSRVQSETVRRFVIGVIMAALLAGSVALAKMMSERVQIRTHPPMTAMRLGAFALQRPALWRIQPAALAEQPSLGPAAAFVERTGSRRLVIAELRYDQPVTPDHAFDEFLANQFPAPAKVLLRQFSRYGATCGVASVIQRDETNSGWQYLATVTLDGRRHVALCLSGPNVAEAADQALISLLAESVIDKRYDTLDVGKPIALGDAGSLTMPKNVPAFRLNEADQPVPRYLLISGGEFFTLEITPLPADFVQSTTEQAGGAPAAAPTPPPAGVSKDVTPDYQGLDDMLETVLRWRHRDLTGAFPTQAIMAGRSKNHVFFALRVGEWKPLSSWIEFLAVRLENNRGVLIDVTAAPSAGERAEDAAFYLANRIRPPAAAAAPAPATQTLPQK